VLLRLPYLALTSVFTFIRLLPMSDADKNVEILALRHQLDAIDSAASSTNTNTPLDLPGRDFGTHSVGQSNDSSSSVVAGQRVCRSISHASVIYQPGAVPVSGRRWGAVRGPG
jgi:hypothetical protein